MEIAALLELEDLSKLKERKLERNDTVILGLTGIPHKV